MTESRDCRACEGGVPGGPRWLPLLVTKARHEVEHRFADVMARQVHAGAGVEAAREYVEAMLGLEVWSHRVYGCLEGPAHEGAGHSHG